MAGTNFDLGGLGKMGESLKGIAGKEGLKGSFLGRAWEKMKTANVSGTGLERFMNKAKVFLTSMFTELMAPQKAEVKASEEAAKEGAVVTEKFKPLQDAVKELDNHKEGSSKEAFSAFNKISQAIEGKPVENFTFDEMMNLGAVGIIGLKALKLEAEKSAGGPQQHEEALFAKLQEMDKASAGTKLVMEKMLTGPIWGLFKPKGDKDSLAYKVEGASRGMKLLGRIKRLPADKYAEATVLTGLKQYPIPERDKAIDFVAQYILPSTTKENVGIVLDSVAEMKASSLPKDEMYKRIAKVAIAIHPADFDNLLEVFVGGRK